MDKRDDTIVNWTLHIIYYMYSFAGGPNECVHRFKRVSGFRSGAQHQSPRSSEVCGVTPCTLPLEVTRSLTRVGGNGRNSISH